MTTNKMSDSSVIATAPKAREGEIGSIKTGNVQWMYKKNTMVPIGETTRELPSGLYTTAWDRDADCPVPQSITIKTDELFVLPLPVTSKVLFDITSFWENRETYKKYRSTYKRGVLLYGIPGCGKSSIISLLIKELILKHSGVVFVPTTGDQIEWLLRILPQVKEIEPDKKIIVVLEDIDNFIGQDKTYIQTMLLNFLDGMVGCDGVVTIATTNYPEQLQERITNRPSRFDRRYEVGRPNAEVRRFYIESKLKQDDIKSIDIEEIVAKTEGFTIDHLKEYLLSVFVLGYSHEEAYSEVSSILETKVLKNTKDSQVGFKGPR